MGDAPSLCKTGIALSALWDELDDVCPSPSFICEEEISPNLISYIMSNYVFHASRFFKYILPQSVYLDLSFSSVFLKCVIQICQPCKFIFRNVPVLPPFLEDT